MIGNGAANYIQTNSGDDVIFGLGGNDEIFGDSGFDRAHGGSGDDVCLAEARDSCTLYTGP